MFMNIFLTRYIQRLSCTLYLDCSAVYWFPNIEYKYIVVRLSIYT